jgi:copper transport protein
MPTAAPPVGDAGPTRGAAPTVGMMADVTVARPTPRAVVAGVLLAVLGVLAIPAAPAHAHAALVSTSPAKASVVATAPTQVILTFTESVSPVRGRIQVIAPDGQRADRDDVRGSGAQVLIELTSGGPQGTYLVTFRVLSADSHPVSGSFTYSVGAPSPGGPPTATGVGGEASPVIGVVYPVVRWIGYTGLLLLVGTALVLGALWPQRLDRRGPGRMIWIGAGAVAAATIGELIVQVPYVAGGGLGDIRGSDVREVLTSQYGTAHLVRLGVLVAALVLLRPILGGKGWGADRVLLAVLGTIGVATWSVSGHPSATPAPLVTVLADMVHIAAMSVWLGGLVMLIAFLLPRASATELGAIMPVWSRWATYAVATLILTGTAQALVEVASVDALVSTKYGWLVVAKVGLVASVAAVASLSRRLVVPIGQGDTAVVGTLRRAVIAEAAIAAVILGLTSVLVQTTPARTAAAQSSLPTIQSAVLTDALYVLTVDVQPATVGINEIHLYASAPDGQPSDIKEWRVRASLPAQGIEPIDATILPVIPSHSIGQISLPVAGTWTFSFTLRTSEIDQSTVTADFVVSS